MKVLIAHRDRRIARSLVPGLQRRAIFACPVTDYDEMAAMVDVLYPCAVLVFDDCPLLPLWFEGLRRDFGCRGDFARPQLLVVARDAAGSARWLERGADGAVAIRPNDTEAALAREWPALLAALTRACVYRATGHAPGPVIDGPYAFDPDSVEFLVDGQPLATHLSTGQKAILEMLLVFRGLPIEALASNASRENPDPLSVRVQVSRIRGKLETERHRPILMQSQKMNRSVFWNPGPLDSRITATMQARRFAGLGRAGDIAAEPADIG